MRQAKLKAHHQLRNGPCGKSNPRCACFSAFLLFRPASEHRVPPLLAEFLFAEVRGSRLTTLPAQSDRVRILLCHSMIILRTVT
jgi:hypothetical protein